LVADPSFGLALQNAGYRNGAIWPHGYSARRESGVVVLIDPSGRVVAREGDRILASGGSGPDDAVNVECDIQVNSQGLETTSAVAATALPPGFDCGSLAMPLCREVAAVILDPAPVLGFDPKRIVSAHVKHTVFKVCPSAGDMPPTVDVDVLLTSPSQQVTVTLAQYPGGFTVCTY
jgi:hypothetical protein